MLLWTYIGGHGLEYKGSHRLVLNTVNNNDKFFYAFADVISRLLDCAENKKMPWLNQIIVVPTCRHRVSQMESFT